MTSRLSHVVRHTPRFIEPAPPFILPLVSSTVFSILAAVIKVSTALAKLATFVHPQAAGCRASGPLITAAIGPRWLHQQCAFVYRPPLTGCCFAPIYYL